MKFKGKNNQQRRMEAEAFEALQGLAAKVDQVLPFDDMKRAFSGQELPAPVLGVYSGGPQGEALGFYFYGPIKGRWSLFSAPYVSALFVGLHSNTDDATVHSWIDQVQNLSGKRLGIIYCNGKVTTVDLATGSN